MFSVVRLGASVLALVLVSATGLAVAGGVPVPANQTAALIQNASDAPTGFDNAVSTASAPGQPTGKVLGESARSRPNAVLNSTAPRAQGIMIAGGGVPWAPMFLAGILLIAVGLFTLRWTSGRPPARVGLQ